MKYKIINDCKWLPPKKYYGVAIYPFVFVDKKRINEVRLNHEVIHLRQQLEMLILPFYLWYTIEYIIRVIQYRNWDVAYKNISFEREAYSNEKNINYLQQRKFCSWVKYLKQ